MKNLPNCSAAKDSRLVFKRLKIGL